MPDEAATYTAMPVVIMDGQPMTTAGESVPAAASAAAGAASTSNAVNSTTAPTSLEQLTEEAAALNMMDKQKANTNGVLTNGVHQIENATAPSSTATTTTSTPAATHEHRPSDALRPTDTHHDTFQAANRHRFTEPTNDVESQEQAPVSHIDATTPTSRTRQQPSYTLGDADLDHQTDRTTPKHERRKSGFKGALTAVAGVFSGKKKRTTSNGNLAESTATTPTSRTAAAATTAVTQVPRQNGDVPAVHAVKNKPRAMSGSLFAVDDSSDPTSKVKENPISDEERQLLPQMRMELQRFIQQHASLEGRRVLAANKATSGHWRDGYRRDDLPHLYAMRDAQNEDRPYRKYTQADMPPPQHAPWPTDINTLPDRLLNRFLRARKHKVTPAVEQLAKTLAWRSEYGADELASLPLEPCHTALMGVSAAEFHSFDKDGRPIFMNQSGVVNIDQFSKVMSDSEIIITHVYSMEKVLELMEESSQRMGHRVDKLVSVQDLEGLGLAHRKLAHTFTAINAIDATYYAELVHSIWLVNCPSVFSGIWDYVIKPWLDPVTLKKVQIFGSSKWVEAAKEAWGADAVPRIYGGNCKCPGQCFPLLTASTSNKKDDVHIVTNINGESDTTTVKASKRLIVETEYGARPADAKFDRTVYYEYTVEASHEIDFSIEWRDALQKGFPITTVGEHKQPKRVTGSDGKQKGQYTVKSGSAGALRLVFSNAHSSWNSKTVHWSVKVVSADPDS